MQTLALTLGAVGLAALWDARTGRIPNSITLSTITLGIILNAYYLGWTGFKGAMVGMLVGASFLLIPFMLGVVGAGDVKMLAAVGALNGAKFAFWAFLYGALAGGIIAAVFALMKGRIRSVLACALMAMAGLGANLSRLISTCGVWEKSSRDVGILNALPTSGIGFPYGIAIFVGTVAACLLR